MLPTIADHDAESASLHHTASEASVPSQAASRTEEDQVRNRGGGARGGQGGKVVGKVVGRQSSAHEHSTYAVVFSRWRWMGDVHHFIELV